MNLKPETEPKLLPACPVMVYGDNGKLTPCGERLQATRTVDLDNLTLKITARDDNQVGGDYDHHEAIMVVDNDDESKRYRMAIVSSEEADNELESIMCANDHNCHEIIEGWKAVI